MQVREEGGTAALRSATEGRPPVRRPVRSRIAPPSSGRERVVSDRAVPAEKIASSRLDMSAAMAVLMSGFDNQIVV